MIILRSKNSDFLNASTIFFFLFNVVILLKLCESQLIDMDNLSDHLNVTNTGKIKIILKNRQIIWVNRKVIEQYSVTRKLLKESIVYEFLGVPFAQPPINEKRFQFPHNLTNALPTNTYNATYHRDSCMQEFDSTFPGFSGSEMWNPPGHVSEDCLYMNLWVSVTADQDRRFRKESSKMLFSDMVYLGYSATNSQNFRQLTSLFWIYGGSFNSGSANLKVYDGTIMAALEDIVVISANYRVGPFGFLYLNNRGAPGNAGLADQVQAIEWYKEYYSPLFGDPNSNMVLFGESAGAMSIHDLLLSEKNHLFNRAILQSSSSYSDLTYRKPADALKVSLSLAEKLNCLPDQLKSSETANTTNQDILKLSILKIKHHVHGLDADRHHHKVLQCLLKVDAKALSEKQFEIDYVNRYLPMQFVPTSDYHELIPIDPTEYLFSVTSRPFKQDILAGLNQDEGTYFAFYAFNGQYYNRSGFHPGTYDNKFVADRLYEAMKTKYPTEDYNIKFSPNPTSQNQINEYYYERLTGCVADAYTRAGRYVSGDPNLDFDLDTPTNRKANSPELAWRKFSKIIGDLVFACPTIDLANRYAEKNPHRTFFYKFNKRANSNPWPKWMGVMHGYELEYLFGIPWLNQEQFNDDDRLLSRKMINYWANFAKYGKLFSEFDTKKSEHYVDFTSNLSKEKHLDESGVFDLFNKLFINCDLFTQLHTKESYASKYDICKNHLRTYFNKSPSSFAFVAFKSMRLLKVVTIGIVYTLTFSLIIV